MPSIDLRLLLQRTLTANTNQPVANANEPAANPNEPVAPAATEHDASAPRVPPTVVPPRRVREPPPRAAPVRTNRALRPRRRS